ncbi:MAG: 6-bladed beta-propeller, partial [Burkholderiales bacterium]|nr:6-bladed beta-propeller [Burkholderiales bacterium]
FGPCSAVAVRANGNILVFSRSEHALMEFNPEGMYLRSLGRGIFDNPHGLKLDPEGNIWATDTVGHIVVKMNSEGRIRMVLGVKGRATDWHQAGHLRCFNEPNDIAFGPKGEVYVTQGHGKGESRVIKFDGDGNFLTTWGGEGKGPGEFNQPHAVLVDPQGLVYIADRSNQRLQVFDGEGKFLREKAHPGTPCGLALCSDQKHIMMAHGHAGRIMKLDMDLNLLAATGGQGKGPNRYGEAHYLALDADDNIYVADSLNWNVQKLVRNNS